MRYGKVVVSAKVSCEASGQKSHVRVMRYEKAVVSAKVSFEVPG